MLSRYYTTNTVGLGAEREIEVDGDISDWDSSLLIAQGAANDDVRVYLDDFMAEIPLDLYALYAAYDDNNLYLMWKMTNVQDVFAPDEEYPMTEGFIYQNRDVPIYIAIDTGMADKIGNKGQTIVGGTVLDSGITFERDFNRLIVMSSNSSFSSKIYGGTDEGLNPAALFDGNSGIFLKSDKGILSKNVYGILSTGTGSRSSGDICSDSSGWVDFNTKNHQYYS